MKKILTALLLISFQGLGQNTVEVIESDTMILSMPMIGDDKVYLFKEWMKPESKFQEVKEVDSIDYTTKMPFPYEERRSVFSAEEIKPLLVTTTPIETWKDRLYSRINGYGLQIDDVLECTTIYCVDKNGYTYSIHVFKNGNVGMYDGQNTMILAYDGTCMYNGKFIYGNERDEKTAYFWSRFNR